MALDAFNAMAKFEGVLTLIILPDFIIASLTRLGLERVLFQDRAIRFTVQLNIPRLLAGAQAVRQNN